MGIGVPVADATEAEGRVLGPAAPSPPTPAPARTPSGPVPGQRRREIRCRGCGYGAVIAHPLQRCPMCGADDWRFIRNEVTAGNARERAGMESGSSKHSARLDDEMAEESRQAEFSGEDQPAGTYSSGLRDSGAGLSAAEVQARSTLAMWLAPGHFPATRERLIDSAINAGAPDEVVDAVRRLPPGREFGNVGDAWQALGGRDETPPD